MGARSSPESGTKKASGANLSCNEMLFRVYTTGLETGDIMRPTSVMDVRLLECISNQSQLSARTAEQ